ncbi:MAG TPA: hypothetical protein VF982_07500 [Anaerolineales bacterium]
MEETTSDSIWKSAYRLYVLVKVTAQTPKADVARDIYALNETELDTSQHFVTRACVVDKGPFDILVPIYARSLEKLKELEAIVKSRAGVEEETSEVASFDDTLDPREVHHPWPPHEARGYVPQDEANPSPPGPTGANAWG